MELRNCYFIFIHMTKKKDEIGLLTTTGESASRPVDHAATENAFD
jgi:hypothetical protein